MGEFEQKVGLLKIGTLQKYDYARQTITVSLDNETSAVLGKSKDIKTSPKITIPCPLFSNNGLFVGCKPVQGSRVVLGQGPSGSYFFVSYLPLDNSKIPSLSDDELLIQANDQTKITLNTDNDITIGGSNKIHINTELNNAKSLITLDFDNENVFTQSYRAVNGIVRREKKINKNYTDRNLLTNDDYVDKLTSIGLDPSISTNLLSNNSGKNPPLVENRQTIYEFAYDSDVTDDFSESQNYKESSSSNSFELPNRRIRRTDTLSLSLVSPNYLIEEVKGTVVDTFGNLLDLNRYPLPIGQKYNNTLNSEDKESSYKDIRAEQRKSLAYHFELNARKDLSGTDNTITIPDVNSSDDYARSRSRLFIDIDKEGQFKINVPASSERGNVPLLTRYENYSTIGEEDNNNPNKLFYRDDNLDILHDSFVQSENRYDLGTKEVSKTISIKNNDSLSSPQDRLKDNEHISYGTAHHNILETCIAHQNSAYINYQNAGNETININDIPLLKNVISPIINIGDSPNAGGRSGSINFDGSIDLNIGANTIDRQSMVIDTAGGIVGAIGRDKQNISAAISLDGQLLLQVGGKGVNKDSRFKDKNNEFVGGVIDIRVFAYNEKEESGGFATMIRIDENGVSIMTPGSVKVHAEHDLTLRSDMRVYIEGEDVLINKRQVAKLPGVSI